MSTQTAKSTITLDTKVVAMKNRTLGEIMTSELSSLGFSFSGVAMRDTDPNSYESLENVKLNTKREFKPNEILFITELASVYKSLYVTRQMVVAFNRLRGQVSCPNYINKNRNCMTQIPGLYRLPKWILPKELRETLDASMKTRALEYREQLKAAAAAEATKAKSEPAAEEPAPAKAKGASKVAKKKTSKKAEKPAEVVAETTVQPTAEEPAEVIAAISEAAETTETVSEPSEETQPVE